MQTRVIVSGQRLSSGLLSAVAIIGAKVIRRHSGATGFAGGFAGGIITAIIGAKLIQRIGIAKTGYSIWATVITVIITANRFAVVIIGIIAQSIKWIIGANACYSIGATDIFGVITTGGFSGGIITAIIGAKVIQRIGITKTGYSIGATAITVIITANRFAGGVISYHRTEHQTHRCKDGL